ncbi:MAG TPA: sigma-70 family RNA polymerase sigma factor, partial [Chroococcales cyanobacterium]
DSLDAVLVDNPSLEPASQENIEVEIERRFTHQLLFSSLAQLPTRYRQIFVLRYQQDLSYDEIAETVGESTSSIKSLLFRIREKLRKIMQAGGSDQVEKLESRN